MKMQLDQQCDHPGDQPPVQLYILVVYMHTNSVLRYPIMYSDELSLYFTISVQSLALTEEWL